MLAESGIRRSSTSTATIGASVLSIAKVSSKADASMFEAR
jgi:hypothetical protein